MATLVVDTSVLVRIVKQEETWQEFKHILQNSTVLVPAVCLVELSLLVRVARYLEPWASELVERAGFQMLGLSVEEARIAVAASRGYGKGSGHPAQLNFGDCLVYRAARSRDLPLLFTGNDFALTDIVPANAVET